MNPIDSSMAELEAEIHALAGYPFDLGSAQELGETLFERLSLPGGERLEDGSWDVGPRVLERLAAAGFLIASRVLVWQCLSFIPEEPTEQDGEELLAKIRRFIEEDGDFEILEEDGTMRLASESLAEFDRMRAEDETFIAWLGAKASERTAK